MTTSSDDGGYFSAARRSIFSIIGTALLGALMGGIFLPMITFAAMILAGVTSNCANNSAAPQCGPEAFAIASIPVWAALMFALGIYSGLKSR